jgi:predicted CXXCH cytochrome family protein
MHAPRKPHLRDWLIFAGLSVWGLLVVSCVTTERAVIAPPQIAGATLVGTKQCAQCHAEVTDKFAGATHARLASSNADVKDTACENCHGAGSLHVKAGGGAGTIINPRKSPETCFQCHLDKRGQFSLPHSHPVLAGKVSCTDCHDPHEGGAVKGSSAADLASENDTCTKCHTAQKGPFVYEHNAMREGCVACHNPHGTINAKMLVARDANLCQRCHLETATASGQIMAGGGAGEDHATRLVQGTCWSAGCHEAVHGSNSNNHFRR